MIVSIVSIRVKPEYRDEFIAATIRNHEHSLLEEGNLRFDFLQSKEDPNNFSLYEAYESEEDAAAHKETAHYREWKEKVAHMMAEARTGLPCEVIAPQNTSAW